MKRIRAWLSIFILVSCTSLSEQQREIKSLNEVYLDNLREDITHDGYMQALQDIDYLRQHDQEIPAAELSDLKQLATEKMQEVFAGSIQAENYLDALRIYRSLRHIGLQAMLPEWQEQGLLLALLRKYDTENNPLCALLTGMQLLTIGEPEPELLQTILELAYRSQNRSALRIILKYMQKQGLPVDELYTAEAAIFPSKVAMLKGTAIIWVDMGIKMKQGIGLPERALGSGFFIDRRGYLLTNYHVIKSEVDPEYEGYSRLYIRLARDIDAKIPARVIGYDRIFDLALLKVELEPEFIFDSIGFPETTPGDKVFVIGSPLDPFLQNTLSSGIISAVGRRRLLQMGDMIQIDAPLNPGNSGGPLIDDNSNELLGIVFAGLQQFEGLNFAITYNWVKKMLPLLFNGGEVKHPWLGMAIDETEHGLKVIYTIPGEAAARAGIQPGDYLTSLNGKKYSRIRDLQEALLEFSPETLLTLQWQRGDDPRNAIVCLTERPFSPIELALQRDLRHNVYLPLFGMRIEEVDNILWQTNYRITEVIPGSAADNIGLSINDPLNIQNWRLDDVNRIALLRIFVKKKKAGYLEGVVQMAAYLENDGFI